MKCLFATVFLIGCGSPADRMVVVRATEDLDLAQVQWAPRHVVKTAHQVGTDRLVLTVDGSTERLELAHPRACVERVSLRGHQSVETTLRPWISVPRFQPSVGFDARFEIRVTAGCDEARGGQIEWRELDGKTIRDERIEPNGWSYAGRTESFSVHRDFGIQPMSPRTRGHLRLEGTWHGQGHEPVSAVAVVAAAARATGGMSVAVDQPVVLAGVDWAITRRPPESHAEPMFHETHTTLTPDARGGWTLQDPEGRSLSLRVGRHDQTPLDCGRSECHASAAEHASHSPMTSIFERGITGELGNRYDPTCAFGCHTTGEPGLADGGFTMVMEELRFVLPNRPLGEDGWQMLPRPVRQLGGVTCTTCHGPGAIPEPEQRWTMLAADVCATCHDAPPRYEHVIAWKGSAMASSDVRPETREGECARCHTTEGFLVSIGALVDRPMGWHEPIGITCAACHAPHSPHTGPALIRQPALPPMLEPFARQLGSSRICVGCHAEAASATAALVWAGRGGLSVADGSALDGPAPHLTVTNGCVGCHMPPTRWGDEHHGRGHAFDARETTCTPCHERRPELDTTIGEQASLLWNLYGGLQAFDALPPHRNRQTRQSVPDRARALHNLRMVLEDPAAAAHNPAYARALLDEAQRAME